MTTRNSDPYQGGQYTGFSPPPNNGFQGLKIKVDSVKFNEPKAMRCICGQLCANVNSYNDHKHFCHEAKAKKFGHTRWGRQAVAL